MEILDPYQDNCVLLQLFGNGAVETMFNITPITMNEDSISYEIIPAPPNSDTSSDYVVITEDDLSEFKQEQN